jgi:hypothetical protein
MRPLRIIVLAAVLSLAWAGAASAYPWPVKPFHKQHPIRGFFGDPRTVFEDGVLAGGFDGPGFFSFHQGVDISAPDGTPVYPVVSGVAHYLGAAVLNVDTGKYEGQERVFQYFHIIPVVGEGEHVTASVTVLGYVQTPYGHVHVTEIDGTHAVNPLQPGHLEPYVDHTRPTIRSSLFENQTGVLETPLGLCGRVEIAADAFDTPPLPVPGSFRDLPVTPALVRWSVTRLDGKTVLPWRTTADFRKTLPPNSDFSAVYAKGTYENAPRFGTQQYTAMPGRYLFLLAPNFDTTSLGNGVYTLAVYAADVRGNSTIFHQRFSVLNARSGVCPGSLAAPPASTPPPSEPPPPPGG